MPQISLVRKGGVQAFCGQNGYHAALMKATARPSWKALESHAQSMVGLHLRQLFAADPQRFDHCSVAHQGLMLDYAKQRVTPETMALLRAHAQAVDVAGWRAKMLAGEAINHTEGRAVRHMDLRAGESAPEEVKAVLAQMQRFCDAVHDGAWRGYDGRTITDVVNIGIGGSDLGARMATRALRAHQRPGIEVHFASNVDGSDLAGKLRSLDPATTLFVVASKTFTTIETMTNARTARDWLVAAAGDEQAVSRHFVAVSTNRVETSRFGIAAENVFEFWDWVGGRFSLWSAIGLPLALALGFEHFSALLAGARAMDHHFCTAPDEQNLPLTQALLAFWNTNFLGADVQAVLPYSQSLVFLPAYLQQLEMESNGKQVGRDGAPVGIATNPILWGEAGTNGQHSFFQLIHQGGRLMPCDFILLVEPDFPLPGHHEQLLAHCLAQSAALAFGQTAEEARAAGTPAALLPYKVFPGNQPSSTLVLPRLDPHTLGQLLAMYEHKVFCLGVLWGLNSFDQWGVELGKTLATRLLPFVSGAKAVEGAAAAGLDASTRGLLQALRR